MSCPNVPGISWPELAFGLCESRFMVEAYFLKFSVALNSERLASEKGAGAHSIMAWLQK